MDDLFDGPDPRLQGPGRVSSWRGRCNNRSRRFVRRLFLADSMTTNEKLLLSIRGVAKRFGSVVALRGADMEVRAGEVHALMGANGAGKSTLVKIITGVYPADGGQNRPRWKAGGLPIPRRGAEGRHRLGLSGPAIVPDLTVAQNMRLARVPLDKVRASMRRLGIDNVDLSRRAGRHRFRDPAPDRPVARHRLRSEHPDARRDHRRVARRSFGARLRGHSRMARKRPERHFHLAPHGRGRPRFATAPPCCATASRSA